MAFGFGPGADMNNAHKSNLRQLKSRKSIKEIIKQTPESAHTKARK